ncbi:MAG TPA: hypothetical protein VKB31_07270 [Trueperaceae bacterium]|nr:hypothetical protein [Trueperaceae bacterium]
MSPRTRSPGRTRSPDRTRMLPAAVAAAVLLLLGGAASAGPAAFASALAVPAAPPTSTLPAPAIPAAAAAPAAPIAAAPIAGTRITATPITAVALATVTGGICTTCSSGGGGGGGGDGSSGSPQPIGSPYWVTYRVTLDSSYYSPASLASQINNWSSATITGTFGYTRKVIRDVQFSGGFASFVSASVGGEVSLTTSASVSYPVPPMSFAKLYVKYYTARQTYYGHQYQDFSDGSRVIVATDYGPYQSTSTVLGYVTGPL